MSMLCRRPAWKAFSVPRQCGADQGREGRWGIGPLAIGNVKYKVESGLFKKMIELKKAVAYDFQDAFQLARQIAK